MNTNYNIKGTGVVITDEVRTYIEKQLTHVGKLVGSDSTLHIDIELKHLEEGRSGKYCAEFTLSMGGTIYRAEKWGSTLHEAIDVASNQLINELARDKKKKLHVFRHTAVKVKEYLRGWRDKI